MQGIERRLDKLERERIVDGYFERGWLVVNEGGGPWAGGHQGGASAGRAGTSHGAVGGTRERGEGSHGRRERMSTMDAVKGAMAAVLAEERARQRALEQAARDVVEWIALTNLTIDDVTGELLYPGDDAEGDDGEIN